MVEMDLKPLFHRRAIAKLSGCGLLLTGLGAATAIGQVGQSDETVDAAYYALKRDDTLQFDLPTLPPPDPPPAWTRALGEFLEPVITFIAWIATPLFWLGVGGLVMTILYFVAKAIFEQLSRPSVGREIEVAPPVPLYQPSAEVARVLLEEVDRLAREGRYGEAVHTLLFRSIQDIADARPNAVRRSLTSREIGRLDVLTDAARGAFTTIANVSEQAHFGGREIDADGFSRARAAYSGLAGLKA